MSNEFILNGFSVPLRLGVFVVNALLHDRMEFA